MFALAIVAIGCEKPDPTVQMIDALGGYAAIDRLKSLAVEAECTGPSGPFRTEVQSFRPDKVYFHQTSERDTTIIYVARPFAWTIVGKRIELVDAGVVSFARGHEFHLLLFDFHTRFLPPRIVAGDETIDGHLCTRVTMSDWALNAAALCIDKKSHLPCMLELSPSGAVGPVHIYFDDWRRVGELLYFRSFRLIEGSDRTFTYRYTKISPNTVDFRLWEMPDSLKLEPGY